MMGKTRAVGTFRGSAVKIPSTSFQIWSSEASRPTARSAERRHSSTTLLHSLSNSLSDTVIETLI
ncbi:aspartate kinase [Moniliophthora roreri]|nr:aspartate kinase [Moniliophthora roreri]